jgi:hypothetical protein
VFDNNYVKYNIILGTHFLSKTRIKLNYSEENMEWLDCSIPLRPPGDLDSKEFNTMVDMFHIQVEDKYLVKIGSNALQQRCWMPEMKQQM